MQIGVDVGGTNTDGVILSEGKVLVSEKTTTTEDVGDGVFNIIKTVLTKGNISPDKISSVMIGTTHFTNALVERKKLQKIAAIRLSLPAAVTKITPAADISSPAVSIEFDLDDVEYCLL